MNKRSGGASSGRASPARLAARMRRLPRGWRRTPPPAPAHCPARCPPAAAAGQGQLVTARANDRLLLLLEEVHALYQSSAAKPCGKDEEWLRSTAHSPLAFQLRSSRH